MRNFKIIIQYDGGRYNGWQRQGNTKNTIQERFEGILGIMCGTGVEIMASGRTDAGTHAQGQVANFRCSTDMSCDEVLGYLNRYLPEDIRVLSVEEADLRFHSRLNAVSKTYEYRLAVNKPDVFIRKYVCRVQEMPELEKMRKAAGLLVGKHDFAGFSSVGKTKKSTVRTVNSVEISEAGGIITIRINADGFLYNMVRIIGGTLFEIGMGRMDEEDILRIFESKQRSAAGTTLPACGLCLKRVYY